MAPAAPVFTAEEKWHVGQGRLVPTTSVDQYAATTAKWFGVDTAELPGVLPNINNFGAAAAGSAAALALNRVTRRSLPAGPGLWPALLIHSWLCICHEG